MKHKITDTAVKRLIAILNANHSGWDDPLPVIKQWAIAEELSGEFQGNLRDLLCLIREERPHLTYRIAHYLSYAMEDAEFKLKAIKRGFDAINEI
jgi:hypothetical protein